MDGQQRIATYVSLGSEVTAVLTNFYVWNKVNDLKRTTSPTDKTLLGELEKIKKFNAIALGLTGLCTAMDTYSLVQHGRRNAGSTTNNSGKLLSETSVPLGTLQPNIQEL